MINGVWNYEGIKQAAATTLASFKTTQARPKSIAGIAWIAEQFGLSERQARRLAIQKLLPGLYRSQTGGRWKVNWVRFLKMVGQNHGQVSHKVHAFYGNLQ
jgi:hypothetical protein